MCCLTSLLRRKHESERGKGVTYLDIPITWTDWLRDPDVICIIKIMLTRGEYDKLLRESERERERDRELHLRPVRQGQEELLHWLSWLLQRNHTRGGDIFQRKWFTILGKITCLNNKRRDKRKNICFHFRQGSPKQRQGCWGTWLMTSWVRDLWPLEYVTYDLLSTWLMTSFAYIAIGIIHKRQNKNYLQIQIPIHKYTKITTNWTNAACNGSSAS
jgi:hypothetical protein